MMNESGIYPSGNKVLVRPDPVEEVTASGIVIPKEVIDRHGMSTCYGTVVELGPDCFKHTVSITERLIDGNWKEVERTTVGYSEPFAVPGERIVYSMYVGRDYTGKDGVDYKLMNDEDIISRADDGVVQTTIDSRKAISDG